MRLFKPALILIILLAAGLLSIALLPGSWWPWLSATLSKIVTGQPSAESIEQTPRAVGTKTPIKNTSQRSTRHGATFPSPAEPVVPAREPAQPNPPHHFPLAAEVQPGTPDSAILAAYGEPPAIVTSSEIGHMRERFIYIDPETGCKTLIFFTDGKVTEAQTFRQ